ncbi:MAG: DUF5337 domain-containing protein [Pseudomonadota bacterium]
MVDKPKGPDARLPAIVIAVAACIWLAGTAFGGAMGLPVRFVFLLDLACMAAFVWALVVAWRIWRAREAGE